jgi:hypothetical protein
MLLAVAVSLLTRVLPGVLGAEGVRDALVGNVGLPVDAVSVDLQQHRDAGPSATGKGRRHSAMVSGESQSVDKGTIAA